MDFSSDGNIKALSWGFYILVVIIAIGFYNFVAKVFFDPCCQTHTSGENMLEFSKYLSFAVGLFIIALAFITFLKFLASFFVPEQDISWRPKSESVLNTYFLVILIINFCLLLMAQIPQLLIGCTTCVVK